MTFTKFSLQPIQLAAMLNPVLDWRKGTRRIDERRHLFLFRTHRNNSYLCRACSNQQGDLGKIEP